MSALFHSKTSGDGSTSGLNVVSLIVHHGSHSSSSRPFMDDLKPTVVVISNGSVDSYKHPRAVSLATYEAISATAFQTNKCFLPPPCANVADPFIADTEAGQEAGTILVSVNGVAGTYVVSYGTTSRSFTTKAPSAAAPVSSVVIDSLLPNPAGDDVQLESVTLTSTGTTAVSLQGSRHDS